MDQRIEKAIEIIYMKRDANPSLDAKLPNEVSLWNFMVANYVALKNGKLSKDQINKLNDIDPGWIEHMEIELIDVYDEFTERIFHER